MRTARRGDPGAVRAGAVGRACGGIVGGEGTDTARLHRVRAPSRWPGRASAPAAAPGTRCEARAAPAAAGRERGSARASVERGARPVARCARSRPSARSGSLTGIGELDRVLGGGMVPGSLVLLGGAPGIGKCTLAGMALANLAAAGAQGPLRLRRGVGVPDPPPRRAARRGRPGGAGAGRALAGDGAGDDRGRAPRRLRDRLGADPRASGEAAPGSVAGGPRGDRRAARGRQAAGRDAWS